MISMLFKVENFTFNWTTISVIVAFLSLIISLFTFRRNKIVAEKNLNKKFFDDIFSDTIIKIIPNKLLQIESNKQLIENNCDELETVINDLLDKAMFYKYFEENFYNKIRDTIIKIDEKLVQRPNNNVSTEIFIQYNKELHVLVQNLYKELKVYYSKV